MTLDSKSTLCRCSIAVCMLCWILNLNAPTVIQNYDEFNDESLVPYRVEYRMGKAWRSCWTFHSCRNIHIEDSVQLNSHPSTCSGRILSSTGFSDYVFRTNVSRGGKATKNIFLTWTPDTGSRIPAFDTKIDIRVCLKPGVPFYFLTWCQGYFDASIWEQCTAAEFNLI